MEIAPLPVPKSSQTPSLSFGRFCMACSMQQPLAWCDISKKSAMNLCLHHIVNWYLCELEFCQQDERLDDDKRLTSCFAYLFGQIYKDFCFWSWDEDTITDSQDEVSPVTAVVQVLQGHPTSNSLTEYSKKHWLPTVW